MFLSFSRWLAKAKSQTRKPQRAAKRAATVRKRFIPQVEPLETRLAPAIDFVTNLGGGNTAGSLKAVITAATAGDTIEFQTTGTILLTGSNVSINKNLTIDGTGANITVNGAALSGIAQGGVFHVTSGNVFIRGLTITGGTATSGGSIYNAGTLTLTNDTVTNNTANSFGGGIFNGGNLTLTNDTIANNSSNASGGGIWNTNGGILTATNDTIAHNTAHFGGGGIVNQATLTLTNDTITYNSASGTNGGGIVNTSTLTLTNDTVANNTASSSGGGVYVPFPFGTVTTVYDTILAGNSATNGPDFGGTVSTDNGYNLVGNTTGSSGFTGTGDILNPVGGPGLGALQNNGGPTQTLAEQPGSPALGAGNTTGAPATDQRGLARIVNGKIDIGAFENQSQWFTQTAPSGATVDVGQSKAFNLGSFTYSGSAPSGWQVDVNWGDGSPHTTFFTLKQGSLGTQNHTYTSNAGSPYTIAVTVSDVDSNFANPPATASVTVDSAVAITTASVPAGTAGATYVGATIAASGGSGSYTFSSSGSLDGLTLTAATGALSGTPTAVGSFAFTVTATDTNGGSASRNYTLIVAAPSLLVTNTNDSGAGSLRQAISNATNYYSNGTITFAPNVTGTITLASTLTITASMTIQGPGAGVLTVSGNNLNQVFNIGATTDAISGLTISGGKGVIGGGIFAKGNLTLANDTIANNTATNGGGGVFTSRGNLTVTGSTIANNSVSSGVFGVGGAIENLGSTVTLTNDTIANNTAGNLGGGIYNTQGSLTLTNSTIAYNSAGTGGGIYNATGGNLTVTGSTIANNTATTSGGGIYSTQGSLTLTNDTIANNSAGTSGGGIYNTQGFLTLTNDTIANNTASTSGGGLYNSSSGTVKPLYNNILDANSAKSGGDVFNARSTFITSSGGNLYGSSAGKVGWKNVGSFQDIQNANPGLGGLQNNGGPTQTISLLPGSPALGNGDPAGAPATDQRGLPRVINGKMDSGAFENQSQLFTQTAPTAGGTYYATRPASFKLGSFTYSGTAASVWQVDVNWGDAGPDTVFTTLNQGSLGSQSHTYAAGTFKIAVSVSDANGNFTQQTSSSFTVNAAPVATTIGVVAGSPQSTTVGTSFSTNLQVLVNDQYSNPMPGVTVLFAATSGTNGASGAFANGTANTLATTNASGDATATIFTANTAAGTFTVNASVSGVGTPALFSLTNNPGPVTHFGVFLSVPGILTAGQKFNVLVEAQDKYGNIVTSDNDNVKLTSTDPKQPLNLTQALVSGQTTFTNVEQDTAGTQTLTASDTTSPGPTGTRNVTVVASVPTITVTAGNNQSTLVNTAFATNLAVTASDQFGNPVPNLAVQFAAPVAGRPTGTFSGSTTVATNASGVATAPSFTANLLAGTYTVTASAGGASPVSFTLTNTSPLGPTANDIYVENVYALLLNRVADSGAVFWVNQLNAGTLPATVVQDIEGSTEYLDDMVQALYQHYLGRPAASGDLSYWSGQLASNTIESVTATILATPEYFNDAGGNNTGFVQRLYQQVLGRTGSVADVQNWVNSLNSGATRAQVALDFLTSQEYRIDLLNGGPWVPYTPLTNWGGYYPEFLLRSADPGGLGSWLQAFQSGMSDQAVLAAIFGSNEGYGRWS